MARILTVLPITRNCEDDRLDMDMNRYASVGFKNFRTSIEHNGRPARSGLGRHARLVRMRAEWVVSAPERALATSNENKLRC